MALSQRLRLSDVRSAFRLLGEVRELGDNPLAWRRHMLEGLNRLVGTQVGIAVAWRIPIDGTMPEPEQLLDLGWAGEAERNCWFHYIQQSDWRDDPTVPHILGSMAA